MPAMSDVPKKIRIGAAMVINHETVATFSDVKDRTIKIEIALLFLSSCRECHQLNPDSLSICSCF
jgi:hypothetical protein